ncbi:hypothetical protein PybrP1_006612, partial [[Pythium] brassicae (nom. inval.)]
WYPSKGRGARGNAPHILHTKKDKNEGQEPVKPRRKPWTRLCVRGVLHALLARWQAARRGLRRRRHPRLQRARRQALVHAHAAAEHVRLRHAVHSDPLPAALERVQDQERAARHSNGSVEHWHITSGKCLHAITNEQNQLYSLDYRSDGAMFATAGKDHAVRVYDEATKAEVTCMKGGRPLEPRVLAQVLPRGRQHDRLGRLGQHTTDLGPPRGPLCARHLRPAPRRRRARYQRSGRDSHGLVASGEPSRALGLWVGEAALRRAVEPELRTFRAVLSVRGPVLEGPERRPADRSWRQRFERSQGVQPQHRQQACRHDRGAQSRRVLARLCPPR